VIQPTILRSDAFAVRCIKRKNFSDRGDRGTPEREVDEMMAARQRRSGFTLFELMIVVAIICILAIFAIPNYLRFQMRSKTAEVKTNLAAIRTSEEAYFSEFGLYLEASPSPVAIPGTQKVPFVTNAGFARIGWKPEGLVFFSYGVSIAPDGTGYTADGGADLDGDLANQFWGYVRPDQAGLRVNAAVGCPVALMELGEVSPCTPQSGQSVF
jgi:type IV pilus assembly protein PilA